MVKSFEFVWFYYIVMLMNMIHHLHLNQVIFFFPSVTHILIDDIVVLLIGLNVIPRGSNVNE